LFGVQASKSTVKKQKAPNQQLFWASNCWLWIIGSWAGDGRNGRLVWTGCSRAVVLNLWSADHQWSQSSAWWFAGNYQHLSDFNI